MNRQAKLVRIEKHGEGYDVYSFDKAGKERFIEVKTTTGVSKRPFFISDNEWEFMKQNHENYFLYRVYEFNKEKNNCKVFILKGDLRDQVFSRPSILEIFIKSNQR